MEEITPKLEAALPAMTAEIRAWTGLPKKLESSIKNIITKDGKAGLIKHLKTTRDKLDALVNKFVEIYKTTLEVEDDNMGSKAEAYKIDTEMLLDKISNIHEDDLISAFDIKYSFIFIYSSIINAMDELTKIYKSKTQTQDLIPKPTTPIDRTTVERFSKCLTHKDCFTVDYSKTKTVNQVVINLKDELGREPKEKEIFEALIKEKQYIDEENGYIARHFGDHYIAINLQIFSPKQDEIINSTLKNVSLYDMTHRLFLVIFKEVINQKKTTIIISKAHIIKELGHTTNDKYIYDTIKKSLTSLNLCSYRWVNSNPKKGKNEPKFAQGIFLINIVEFNKEYVLTVNEIFVKCALEFIEDDTDKTNKERCKVFPNGYINYPSNFTKLNLTPTAHYLFDFLIRDTGNNKIKHDEQGYKVVVYKVERYIKEARLNYNRPRENYHALIEAFEELIKNELIHKIEPGIDELKQMRPTKAMTENLRVWVFKNSVELNNQIGKTLSLSQ